MAGIKTPEVDFGVIDFLVARLTFDGQDVFRLLLERFGHFNNFELNVYAALSGMLKAISAFETYCVVSNENLIKIKKSILSIQVQMLSPEIHEKISSISVNVHVSKRSEIQFWSVLEICNDFDDSEGLLKFVGAFVCLSISNSKLPLIAKNILSKTVNYGKEILSEGSQKVLARLLLRAQLKFSAIEKSFASQVKTHYHFKNLYASQKERQAVIDWRSMPVSEYLSEAKRIRENVATGNLEAIVEALALLLSFPPQLVLQVPLVNPFLDEYILAIDTDRGAIFFDLSLIFPNGAKPNNLTNSYESSSNILVKPLPNFLKKKLDDLVRQNPNAKTIHDLFVDISSFEENQLTRLINTSAKFAIIRCGIDAFDAAIICGDFRSIPTSKNYYRRTTRQTVWQASTKFFDEIGWGPACEISEGMAFGSQVVVREEVLKVLFQNLSQRLEVLRPANRCGIESLLKFHNEYVVYNATFTILCLSLRNANPIRLEACDFNKDSRYVLIDDKHVLGAASSMPVAITDSLACQLNYWRNHCAAMLKRLQKLNHQDQKLLALLLGIGSQRRSPLFFISNKPYVISVSQLATTWNLPLVENFSRHFWESKFNQLGVSSRFSSAHLRHQSNGALSWASDSDFVLTTFIDTISLAQEQVLGNLSISPKHGIARRSE